MITVELPPAASALIQQGLDELGIVGQSITGSTDLNKIFGGLRGANPGTGNGFLHNSPGPDLGEFLQFGQAILTYINRAVSFDENLTYFGIDRTIEDYITDLWADAEEGLSSIGITVSGGLTTSNIIEFDINFSLGKEIEYQLDLSSLLPFLDSSGNQVDLGLSVGLDAQLSLRLDLNDFLTDPDANPLTLDDMFIEVGFIELNARVGAANLTFSADLDVIELGIRDALAEFTFSAGVALTDLTPEDGRLTITDIVNDDVDVDVTVTGALNIVLPIVATSELGSTEVEAAATIAIIDNNVFDDTSATISATGFVTLDKIVVGDFLQIDAPRVDFLFQSGSQIIGLSAAGASINIFDTVTASITDGSDADEIAISGSLDLDTNILTLMADEVDFTVENLLTAHASNVVITHDSNAPPEQEVLGIEELSVTLIPFDATLDVMPVMLAVGGQQVPRALSVRNNGFTLGKIQKGLDDFNLGSFLNVTNPAVFAERIDYTAGGPFSTKLGFTAELATLDILGVITADLGTIEATYDIGTAVLEMNVAELQVNVAGSVLTAIGTDVDLMYDFNTEILDLSMDQLIVDVLGVFTATTGAVNLTFDPSIVGSQKFGLIKDLAVMVDVGLGEFDLFTLDSLLLFSDAIWAVHGLDYYNLSDPDDRTRFLNDIIALPTDDVAALSQTITATENFFTISILDSFGGTTIRTIDLLSLPADLDVIVDLGGGVDELTVVGDIDLGNKNLFLFAETILFGPGSTIVTLGDININAASRIDISQKDIDELLISIFGIDPGNSTNPVTLNFETIKQILLGTSTASVDSTGATISGANVTLSAISTVTGISEHFIPLRTDLQFPGFAIALAIAQSSAQVVTGGASITSSEDLKILAESSVDVGALAEADESDNDLGLNAAFAFSFLTSDALTYVDESTTLSANGSLEISAINTVSVETTADGMPSGSTGSVGGSVAVAFVDVQTTARIEDSVLIASQPSEIAINAQTDLSVDTKSIATPGGSTGNGAETQSEVQNNGGKTSEGDLQIAAAISLNIVNADTLAQIDSPTTAPSGLLTVENPITVSGQSKLAVGANADGSTVSGGGDGVGVGVAINVGNVSTKALISGQIDSGSIGISASTLTKDGKSAFSAVAASGAGASDVGVAGSFALNTVTVVTEALISGTVSSGNQNVSINADSSVSVETSAKAKTEGAGESVGVGGSVALSIVDFLTRAEIEDNATLTNVGNLSLNATTTPNVTTLAEAGAAGGSTSIGGAVAITIADVETFARVGTFAGPMALSGTLSVEAAQDEGTVSTTADGTITGASSVGVGAALALTLGKDLVGATVWRSTVATGTGESKISSRVVGRRESTAKGSVAGTSSQANNEGNANAQIGKQRVFGQQQVVNLGSTAGNDSPNTPGADSSEGPVGVGAAVGVTIADISSEATVLADLSVGGSLAVESSANADVITTADASATDTSIGIGAAAAINLADVSNTAYIPALINVESRALTVGATMASRSDETTAAHTLSAKATSGAGAQTVGVAGSFALNSIDVFTEAYVADGATVVGGDVTLIAEASVSAEAMAKAKTEGAGGIAGVGAGVALNIVDLLTRAEIEDNATLTNVGNLSLNATTTPKITTLAEAGASGANVSVGGAVAITIADVETFARVGTFAGPMALSGTLSVEAAQDEGTVSTTADGTVVTGASGVGVGAALALTLGKDLVGATVWRSTVATGTGESKISSRVAGRRASMAKGSAAGTTSQENNEGSANAQIGKQRTYGQEQSADAGSGAGNDSPNTPNADSSGGPIGIGAAVGVTIADISSEATILADLSVGGSLAVESSANADVITTADASATDTSIGIGAAAAINLADVSNTAYIPALINVESQALTVGATMASRSDETTATHSLSAKATSGAGAQTVGVAGSFALNIVDNRTEAVIQTGADVDAGSGAVTLQAENITDHSVEATSATGGDVGVGASVALNILDMNITRAEIMDGAELTGAGDVLVSATAGHTVTTTTEAGAAGGSVSISPSVAISIVDNDTTSRIGIGTTALDAVGTVGVNANHSSSITTTVGADVAGDSVGVGASVGVNIVDETIDAAVARSIIAGGAVEILAESAIASAVIAKAGAGGNSSTARNSDDEASGQVNENPHTNDGGLGRTLPSADAEVGNASSIANSESGNGTSSVGVAAAVAVNVVNVSNTASIISGADIDTAGAVRVGAMAEVDATAKALGSSISLTNESINVAAAVGLNVATVENRAIIDSGSLVEGNGIIIEALTTGSERNEFIAWGASGSGGKGDVGIAGSVGINVVDFTTEAAARDGSILKSESTLKVDAETDIGLQTLAASGGFSTGGTAVGASVAVTVLEGVAGDPMTTAYIAGNADAADALSVTAETDLAPITFTQTLFGKTLAVDFMSMAIAGGATQGEVGVGAAVVVNVIDLTTTAYIDDGSMINQDAVIPSKGSVKVQATSTTDIVSFAGALGLSAGAAGVGLGVDVTVIDKDTRAYIGSGAQVDSDGNIEIDANSSEDILSIAANAGIAQNTGVAGSVSVQVVTTGTHAYIEGTSSGTAASLNAGGNITITADGHFDVKMIAGSLGIGSSAGIGFANTTLTHRDTVEAYLGNRVSAITGGALGLSVAADSSEELTAIAAAGGAASSAAIAGSAVVNDLDENTRAYIGDHAVIDATSADGNNPNVTVKATSNTDVTGIAGAASLSSSTAVGAGLDTTTINKDTQAYIAAATNVTAGGNVVVEALSTEDLASFAVAGAFSGSVGVNLSASIYQVTATTRAYIGNDPVGLSSVDITNVHADGSVIVSADTFTEMDLIAGGLAVAGSVGVGAAGAVAIVDKTTEAFIGSLAQVTGKGQQPAINARTGVFGDAVFTPTPELQRLADETITFNEIPGTDVDGNPNPDTIKRNVGSWEADGFAIGDTISIEGSANAGRYVIADITDAGQTLVLDPSQVLAAETILADSDAPVIVRLSSADGEVDPLGSNAQSGASFAGDRGIDPTSADMQGVAVTATNRDDFETFGISLGGGGTVGVAVGGSSNIIDTNTRAFIGSDAQINTDLSETGTSQDVVVAAANDFYHMGVGTGAALAGTVAGAPGVEISLINNNVDAYIGSGALVKANNDVVVSAVSSEELLTISAGLAFSGVVSIAGGVGYLSIENTTKAHIDSNATVYAEGDILVSASSTTDIDAIAGAVGIGLAGGGAAGSVGTINITKVTEAFIGADAIINANGHGTSLSNIYSGDISGSGFESEIMNGVAVQAHSSEDVFTLAVAGGVGLYAGLAGGVLTTLIDSDTTAFIGDRVLVNTDQSTAFQRLAGETVTFTEVAGDDVDGNPNPDTITRDLGSWETDGFAIGDTISVTNEISPNFGTYTIADITDGGQTLVLESDAELVDEIFLGEDDAPVIVLLTQTPTFKRLEGETLTFNQFTEDEVEANLITDKITRDLGSWETDGFRIGDTISITGETALNPGTHRIADITDDGRTLLLDTIEELVDETVLFVDDAPIIVRFASDSGGSIDQGVNVSAVNFTRVDAFTGALGVGVVGLAGAVDIGSMKNDTSASIGVDAEVFASADIDVNALSIKELDTLALSGAGGIVGLASSVSVWSIGTAFNPTFINEQEY